VTITGPYGLIAKVYFTDGKQMGAIDMPLQPGTVPSRDEVEGLVDAAIQMTAMQMPNMRLLTRAEMETEILGVEPTGQTEWDK
jgi:hypothetical protein